MTADVAELNRPFQALRARLEPLYQQLERVIVGQRRHGEIDC